MESIDIVNAAIAHDKESFMNAFNAALASKVTDALDVKKVEIASNMLGAQDAPEVSQEEPTTNEVETDTIETAGSDSTAD